MPYIRASMEEELPEDTLYARIGVAAMVKKITDAFYDIAENMEALM